MTSGLGPRIFDTDDPRERPTYFAFAHNLVSTEGQRPREAIQQVPFCPGVTFHLCSSTVSHVTADRDSLIIQQLSSNPLDGRCDQHSLANLRPPEIFHK